MDPIQMLWIGDRLSTLERLSVASFLANGHDVHLYTYGTVAGIPAGTRVMDANEIVPSSRIFEYREGFGKGSPAGFANEFRYKLLLELGGVWSDTDTVCLRPFAFLEEMSYAISSERIRPGFEQDGKAIQVNCGLLKTPPGSPFMAGCYEAAASADRDALRWGETGPKLVARRLVEHDLEKYALAPDTICPIDWWDIRSILEGPVPERPEVYGLHLWNAIWRHLGLDKDGSYNPQGAYEILKRRYAAAMNIR